MESAWWLPTDHGVGHGGYVVYKSWLLANYDLSQWYNLLSNLDHDPFSCFYSYLQIKAGFCGYHPIHSAIAAQLS